MVEQTPNNSELEPLTRMQVLVAMGGTAIVLLVIAKAWLHWGNVSLLPLELTPISLAWGLGIGVLITVTSILMYRLWPAYSYSADIYLKIVLSPLLWPDLIWLGLLPGLSEELLFRGVMLADLGVNTLALVVSSLAFGVLHFSGEKQWPYVIWATVVGFILGYSAIATDNLLVPIIAHVFTNLMSGCFWKLKYIGRQD